MTSALAYHVVGPSGAPAVVLLHAICTSSELWQPQLAVWSQRFRLVLVDLPGHGASPAPTRPLALRDYADLLAGVLDELQIERASVVGLSLGGMVAQAFALAHPDRLQALVLAHTSARTEPAVRQLWDRRLQQAEEQGLAAQAAATLERWFTRSFAQASPLTLEWLAAQIRGTSPAGYAAAVAAIQALDHEGRLGEITAPTLVVAGEDDSAVPPAAAAAIAERVPGARLLVIKDAAHLGNVQQPAVFTERVGGFLIEALGLDAPL